MSTGANVVPRSKKQIFGQEAGQPQSRYRVVCLATDPFYT